MMKTLRAQVQNALYAVPAKRKPALRRSDAPDALPLRMELDRVVWYAAEDKKHVWVTIQPRDILLLK